MILGDIVQDLSQDQREKLIKQVRLWGDLNTDAILDSKCQIFSSPTIEGSVGYRVEDSCAIVFGDPLCSPADQPALTREFEMFCKEHKWNIIYAIASEQFTNNSSLHDKRIIIQFGKKLVLDPNNNPLKRSGSKAVLVRKKVKHAINDGVEIKEYISQDEALENEMIKLGETWSESRHGPQVYIAHHAFFKDREGKRWFYASHDQKIVGFLILNELKAINGWLLNNLMISANAPSGTSELLITTALKALEEEHSSRVIIGPVTEPQISYIKGTGVALSWIIRMAFKTAKKMFRLDGQRVFWEKFQAVEEPSFVILDKLNYRTVKALMRAMNVKL